MNYLGIVTVAISLASLLLAGHTYATKERKDNTTELTTVIVSLDSIKTGISDIKAEIASLKTDQREDHDKLIRMEQSLKTAWRQIDKLTGNHKEEEEQRHE